MEQRNLVTRAEQEALQEFKKKVRRICGDRLREIRLFGSRARQQGNPESDLDLLVLVEGLKESAKIQIWDAAYEVFTTTEVLISPLVLSVEQYEKLKQRERLIALDIEREGIPL